MKKIFAISLPFLFQLYACSDVEKKKPVQTVPTIAPSLREQLAGLWSKDSAGYLTNEGFLLQPEGESYAVGRSGSGTWTLDDSNGLDITWTEPVTDTIHYRLLSQKPDGLLLASGGDTLIMRKVPFAMGYQAEILSGFAGNLNAIRPERSYPLTLPSTKMIELNLMADDTGIGFRVYYKDAPISDPYVRKWKGVIIDPNGLRVEVSHRRPSTLTKEGQDYDLKVLGY